MFHEAILRLKVMTPIVSHYPGFYAILQPHRQVHDQLDSEVRTHNIQTLELVELHAPHISICGHRVMSNTHLQCVLTRNGACENTKESSPASPFNLYTGITLGISGCIYICGRGPEEKE